MPVLALIMSAFLLDTAFAEMPTEEQRSEIRTACRSDFIEQCPGVKSAGMEALACLQEHSTVLSPSCHKAVSAVTVRPKSVSIPTLPNGKVFSNPTLPPFIVIAQAQQPTSAQRDAVKSACRSDFMAQCTGVTPGGSEALSCLKQHETALSGSCKQAIAALGGAPAQDLGNSSSKPAGSQSSPAGPNLTLREEAVILRETCGPDVRASCQGVPVGGGAIMKCLRDNLPRVSPGCHKALTHGL
jgi:hypothetical protein